MAQSAAGILELVQAALRPRSPWIDRTSVLLTLVWLLPAAEARISYTLPMTAQIKLDDGCSFETERHVEQGVMHIVVSTRGSLCRISDGTRALSRAPLE
jgi:hypothetical protein